MKTVKKSLVSLLCAGLLLTIFPPLAFADALNYNYVKGGLAVYPDFSGQDFIGAEFKGSYLITPEIFAFGGLLYLTDDVDLTAIHVGGAYRLTMDESTDIYGGLTIEHQDIDGVFDDTALGIRGGVRHRLSPDLEIGGQLRIITGDLDYFGIRGTTRYFLDENRSIVGELDIYDGELGLLVGLSLNI